MQVPVEIQTTNIVSDAAECDLAAVATVAADKMRETGAVFVQTTNPAQGELHQPSPRASSLSQTGDSTHTDRLVHPASLQASAATAALPLQAQPTTGQPGPVQQRAAMATAMAAITPKLAGDALVRWATAHQDDPTDKPNEQPTAAQPQNVGAFLMRPPPAKRPAAAAAPLATAASSSSQSATAGITATAQSDLGPAQHGSSAVHAKHSAQANHAVAAGPKQPSKPVVGSSSSSAHFSGSQSSQSSSNAAPQVPAPATQPIPQVVVQAQGEAEFWKKTALDLAMRLTNDTDNQADDAQPNQVSRDTLNQARKVAAMGADQASRLALAQAVASQGNSASNPAARGTGVGTGFRSPQRHDASRARRRASRNRPHRDQRAVGHTASSSSSNARHPTLDPLPQTSLGQALQPTRRTMVFGEVPAISRAEVASVNHSLPSLSSSMADRAAANADSAAPSVTLSGEAQLKRTS